MIVFKTFLKVLAKYKFMVIMYTVILVAFAGFQLKTSDNSTNFVASKPDVLIVNQDEDTEITENFIRYIKNNCTIKDIENNGEAIDDALFYRDVNYVIYIPQNYGRDFMDGKNPQINVKSTGDYQASYAEMLLSRYIKAANIYLAKYENVQEIIKGVNDTLSEQADVEVTSKLDTDTLTRVTFYYNFANYSILAGCVFVICMILSSFRKEEIRKRTLVSSINYKKHNRLLLASNALFAVVLWAFYVALSFILLGDIMISAHGLIYILNSLIFTICATTIAFFIGTLVNDKNAVSGIVNVVALGSSFLCGAFVPAEWLPGWVLKIAHILPSYWYINSNEILKTLETVSMKTLRPVFINMGVILTFGVVFIVITNIFTKKRTA